MGAGAIATGVIRMLGGFQTERNGVLAGALDAGLGVAVILTASSTSAWVRFVAAAWGICAGTLLLADALRLRRLVSAASEPVAR